MLAAVVAAFFYLRLIVVMYMAPAATRPRSVPDDDGVAGDGGDRRPSPTARGRTMTALAAETAVATVTDGPTRGHAAVADRRPPTRARARCPIPVTAGVVLAICLAVTIGAGLLPEPFLDFARHATILQP